ncbi:MAG: hypothetical protein HY560_08975 [Gemmatimonadetes bacterium]|nr:hypothetical protein [Gemmatimonadota bacterium]
MRNISGLSRYLTILGAASLVGMVAAGCGDSVGVSPAAGLTVSVIAAPVDQASAGGGASSATVEIDRLRLVLGGVKLETAGRDGTVDWVFAESRVIEVDLSGEPVTAHALLDVPAGTYKEIEISIDKLERGNPAEEPLISQHPDAADASIAISGRVLRNGSAEPFTFTAALDRDMEILLEPVLVIAQSEPPAGLGVTLVLKRGGWFRDSAAGWLDPRDPANRSAIEANIQASFEAFEDGDLDGRPGPVVRS